MGEEGKKKGEKEGEGEGKKEEKVRLRFINKILYFIY